MSIKNISIFLVFFSLNSCAPNYDVSQTVELLWDKTGNKTDRLIIFLPGLYDTAKIFKKEQFFSMARNAGIKADMVAASIHIDHTIEEMVVERLETDILQYAGKQAYRNIWLVGVSLGGLNSLLFYKNQAKDICGVLVLAPYLADKALTEELVQAGRLKNWQAKSVTNKGRFEKQLQLLWLWLKEQNMRNNLKKVYLGYGEKDKYAEANKVLENILDKKNVVTIGGGHKWKTGRKLWQQFLSTRKRTGLFQPCK